MLVSSYVIALINPSIGLAWSGLSFLSAGMSGLATQTTGQNGYYYCSVFIQTSLYLYMMHLSKCFCLMQIKHAIRLKLCHYGARLRGGMGKHLYL